MVGKIPEEFIILKHEIFETLFSKSESDYYFDFFFPHLGKKDSRVYRRLYEKGLLIKTTSYKERNIRFIPVPPTFIWYSELPFETVYHFIDTIKKFEDIYFNKYYAKHSILKDRHVVINMSANYKSALTLFLFKYFLKRKGILVYSHCTKERLKLISAVLEEKRKLVTHILPHKVDFPHEENIVSVPEELIGYRRISLIDDTILIDVLKYDEIVNKRLCIGLITTDKLLIDSAQKTVDYYIK